jgi:hypothetical protein
MLSTELGLKTEMTKLMLPCSPFGHGKLIKERNDGIEVIELPWIWQVDQKQFYIDLVRTTRM